VKLRALSTTLFLLAGVASLAASPAAPALSDSLGERVVKFCDDHMGQQVGNGECVVLAFKALGDVGAKRRGKDSPEKGDYTWGELALVAKAAVGASDGKSAGQTQFEQGKPSDIRPGDVIQFRDAKLVHHMGRRWTSQSYHHHTAVVSSVEEGGMVVHVLQQNVNGKRIVQPGTLHLADLEEGWLRFYHPVPKSAPAGGAEQGEPPKD
jgi:hypothetical protein